MELLRLRVQNTGVAKPGDSVSIPPICIQQPKEPDLR
jgi:hypothetical protein